MSNKIIVVIVIILISGGFLLFKNRTIAPTVPTETEEGINTNMPVPGSNVDEMIVVKEFNIEASTYSFSPKTITVNKGERVKITLKNIKGVHDFKIDEFGASTRVLNAGEEETITFLADKSGTFEYYCSVANHRAMGMVGTLIVR